MRLASIRALFVAVLTLGLTTSAWADFDEDWAAYERGDYATALEEWLPLAEGGNAIAQHNLGEIYLRGKGVPQDEVEALKWYHVAAEQGDAEAQFALGSYYLFYTNPAVEDMEAVAVEVATWIHLAAEQGHPIAKENFGMKYDREPDSVQTHLWYNLAAAQGYVGAGETRDRWAKRMTSAQIEEARRLSREWLEEHGE